MRCIRLSRSGKAYRTLKSRIVDRRGLGAPEVSSRRTPSARLLLRPAPLGRQCAPSGRAASQADLHARLCAVRGGLLLQPLRSSPSRHLKTRGADALRSTASSKRWSKRPPPLNQRAFKDSKEYTSPLQSAIWLNLEIRIPATAAAGRERPMRITKRDLKIFIVSVITGMTTHFVLRSLFQ